MRKAISAEVLRIIDGDTLLVSVTWFPALFRKQRVRIARINTPEMNTIQGREARQALCQMLEIGATVKLRKIEKGKYGRLVCDVNIAGVDIAEELLRQGHAQAWADK